MLRIKPLRPSLREKKRYLVYQILGADDIRMPSLHKALVDKVNELLGVFDAANAGILPLECDQTSRQGILRMNHTAVQRVRACFVLIDSLKTKSVQISSLGTSGILKKAKTKFYDGEVEKTSKIKQSKK
ncbi:MAG: Rpp14/Pop5 family protein [Candidatus Woesearchaeota archaeon]